MHINGTNYHLTKHGRKRFRQRVAPLADDRMIIRMALEESPLYRFVWRRSIRNGRMYLVTVLLKEKGGDSNETSVVE